MSSLGWGGGVPAVGAAGQLPAALMDVPVMGSAEQGQVGQVGRATVQPGDQMMALAPGQRPITARKDTALVAHGQSRALGRGHDPGAAPHIQRPAGGAAQGWGKQGQGGPQPPLEPDRLGMVGIAGRGWLAVGGLAAGDQHPGHGPITGQPPTRLGAQRPGPS
jgi:hypothetical protein